MMGTQKCDPCQSDPQTFFSPYKQIDKKFNLKKENTQYFFNKLKKGTMKKVAQ